MSTLIHNVRIFDGEDVITEDGWIFLKDGLIEDIGLESSIPDIHADNIINGKGNTILPGLIDGHVHVHAGISELAQALKFGVTTVLDMFNDPENIANLKKEAAVRADIADVMSSLNGATVKGGWPSQVMLATMEDKELVSSLKVLSNLTSQLNIQRPSKSSPPGHNSNPHLKQKTTSKATSPKAPSKSLPPPLPPQPI